MEANILTERVRTYLISQVTKMAADSPVIGFMKPLVVRVLDNNVHKIEGGLKLIADKDGNVDIDTIMSEMMESVMSSKPFILNTSFIGDIEIGEGLVKLNIPLINNKIAFNMTDLQELKNLLIK